jgi:DNA processing protein
MSTGAERRDLLIALNAAPHLERAAVCRLAEEVDRWAGGAGGGPPGLLAAELGVPLSRLERALALLPEAARTSRAETERAGRLGARIVTRLDPGYPEVLLQLALPPPVLYIRGEIPPGPALAMVGSRRADPYGLEAADLFARALATAGVVIVSGFARGIDAAAHRGALAAGGWTVAVLGCGLGVDYPRGHARLGQEIAHRGALLTELPTGEPPRARHFPVRNRIIAALAGGTLVVQAAARSGSLVTARLALELGREVFAVPGRIFDERSIGPNALIRDGATPVQHPRDILDVLAPEAAARSPQGEPGSAWADEVMGGPPPPGALPAASHAAVILAALPRGTHRSPEELAALAGLPLDRTLGALLELELAGWVRRLPGPAYARL